MALTIAGGRSDVEGESGTGVRGIETPTGWDGWAPVVLSWIAIVQKVVKSTEDKYMVLGKSDKEKECRAARA
jgi:hypothetical protein